MNSKTTERFWKCYTNLPSKIKKQAKQAYKQFQINPYYSSLHFKQVHSTRPIFSIRITKDYRAIGTIQGEDIIWFWIGTHSEYENILSKMRHS
jgi:hypothetical protein